MLFIFFEAAYLILQVLQRAFLYCVLRFSIYSLFILLQLQLHYYRHLFYLVNRPPHGFPHGMPRMQPPGFHREMMMPHEGMMPPPFDMGKVHRVVLLFRTLTADWA